MTTAADYGDGRWPTSIGIRRICVLTGKQSVMDLLRVAQEVSPGPPIVLRELGRYFCPLWAIFESNQRLQRLRVSRRDSVGKLFGTRLNLRIILRFPPS